MDRDLAEYVVPFCIIPFYFLFIMDYEYAAYMSFAASSHNSKDDQIT